jgi:hypothetical protein
VWKYFFAFFFAKKKEKDHKKPTKQNRIQKYAKIHWALPGIEPGSAAPEAAILPLDQRAIVGIPRRILRILKAYVLVIQLEIDEKNALNKIFLGSPFKLERSSPSTPLAAILAKEKSWDHFKEVSIHS